MCRSVLNKRHGRRTLDTRAAQQLQQQGFGLVVGVMRECDEVARLPGECRMAQLACRRFDAVLAQRGNVHRFDMQRNGVLRAEPGTEIRPGIGVLADAVMDVQCGKPPRKTRCELVQQVQQHHGIDSAAQADQDGTVRGNQRRETRGNSVGKRRSTARRAPTVQLP